MSLVIEVWRDWNGNAVMGMGGNGNDELIPAHIYDARRPVWWDSEHGRSVVGGSSALRSIRSALEYPEDNETRRKRCKWKERQTMAPYCLYGPIIHPRPHSDKSDIRRIGSGR